MLMLICAQRRFFLTSVTVKNLKLAYHFYLFYDLFKMPEIHEMVSESHVGTQNSVQDTDYVSLKNIVV